MKSFPGKKAEYERKCSVDGTLVKFQHATFNKKTNRTYILTTDFDFTGVPHKTVERLAAETLLIRWRTAFKNAEKVDDSANGTVVKVTDMLKGRKPRMSREQRVVNEAVKITDPARIAEIIAALQKQQAQMQTNAQG